MPRLNYRHLEYFWHVAREGGVTAAAAVLHVSQPSISAQIRKLEQAVGHDLFRREGRSLTLTNEGRVVFDYADEIFRLGEELQRTVQGGLVGRPMQLVVGVAPTVPNAVAFHLLGPAFELEDPVRVVVRESRTDRLLADLATHEIDLILSDRAVSADSLVRAFNHPLGSSPVDIVGPPLLAHRLREGFPESLDGEPFILPSEGYALRRSLEEWFDAVGIQPRIFAEIEDNDLINEFGEAGGGMFAAPTAITGDIRVRYAVEVVGRAAGVTEDFYAITAERRLMHPAVIAITEGAREDLFLEGAAAGDS
jgi:LysR family transcriptional activator of nhaA